MGWNLLHGRQVHIDFFAGTERDFLLLVTPGFGMASQVVFSSRRFDLEIVREGAVEFL